MIEGAKFCNKCGFSFNSTSAQKGSPFFKKFNWKQIIGVAIFIALMIIGYFGSRNDDAIKQNNDALKKFDSGASTEAIKQFEGASHLRISLTHTRQTEKTF